MFRLGQWVIFCALAFGLSPSGVLTHAHGSVSQEQREQLRALDHKYKDDLKALKAQQKIELHDWEHVERQARHKYFEENKQGADRRKYIKDFLGRRRELLAKQKAARDDLQKKYLTEKHTIESK